LIDEVTVIMGKDMLNKLKEVFDSCKEKGQEHIDQVETLELVHSVAEDNYFDAQMDTPVRETVDREKEVLLDLLLRVKNEYKKPTIEWHTFLGFFTKRGRLRDNEKLNLQLNKKKNADDLDALSSGSNMSAESYEEKKKKLEKDVRRQLKEKQRLVPKTGKGSYNVTVPVPFEFLNAEKGFSIRQKKVEQMIKDKQMEEDQALSFKYKARDIPRAVREKKYDKIVRQSQERRKEAKRQAMAKIKQTEAPFTFYQRDIEKQKKKKEEA
jgi:hypothetical protein